MIAKKRKHENTRLHDAVIVGTFLFIFGGGIFFLGYQNLKINQKRGDLSERLEHLQAQASDLSQRRVKLEEQIKELETQEYQEKILREQGLYQKPGEQVVTVLPPEDVKVEVETDQDGERKWWNPFTW